MGEALKKEITKRKEKKITLKEKKITKKKNSPCQKCLPISALYFFPI